MKLIKKLFFIAAIALFVYGYSGGYLDETIDYTGEVVKDFQKDEHLAMLPEECESCMSIANWNVQTFGKTKWGREETREEIIERVQDYDIVFIQEIRDKSGEVWQEMCLSLEDYDCEISSRAGRSSSKEQYGLLYRDDIQIISIEDYNLDENANDLWERPPLRVDMIKDGYIFSAYNIHIKPDDVEDELDYLEQLISVEENQDNVIILGDFNADGSYYDENNKEVFLEYEWVIDDTIDTTVADSDNTYDRIIVNDNMYEGYKDKGVFTDIDDSVSDHYIVWAQFEI